MEFNPDLKPGKIINNAQLCDIFKCGPQGGMRKSNTTNSLVIVSNRVASIYDDRWEGDVLHYTGMGQSGDQSLTFMQNRTLSESHSNGVDIFLFEVFKDQEYTYRGTVKLVANPYEERQPDESGNPRRVWMFPVRLDAQDAIPPSRSCIEETYVRKLKQAHRLSDEELKRRATYGHKAPGRRQAVVTQYERSPWVVEYAKRRSKGVCELCCQSAPFNNRDDEPYLETHHIEWLARGGADTAANTVALCPNCHRRMHILDHEADKVKLRVRATL